MTTKSIITIKEEEIVPTFVDHKLLFICNYVAGNHNTQGSMTKLAGVAKEK